MTPLHERIHSYIIKNTPDGTWLSKERITSVATSKGFTALEVLDALRLVHDMPDIQRTVHKDTLVYRLRQAPKPKPVELHYKPTPEQQEIMDRERQDFMDNCPFLSDEEREALQTPFKDRTDRQHQLSDTPAGYQVTMERKYGAPKWKRMCEEESVRGIV